MAKKPGKKGEQEDFSDALTLPKVKVFKIGILYKQFAVKETREKLTKSVTDLLAKVSGQKVKLLTRDEIKTYGVAKQIILTPEAVNALSADDPRKLHSEVDMFARSASDRLFELTVIARRERKEKLAKIEAEIAALTAQGKPTGHLSLESETADVIF
jgi:hypothetical protein